MKSLIEYAKPEIKDRLIYLTPMAMQFLADFVQWALDKNLPVVITEAVTTKAEDEALNRVSDSHETGRAFDISSKGWTRDEIDDCVRVFFAKYRLIGATDAVGSPRPIIHHDSGHGAHFHCQVNRRYALSKNPLS